MAVMILSNKGDLTTSRAGISRSQEAMHSYSRGLVAAAATNVSYTGAINYADLREDCEYWTSRRKTWAELSSRSSVVLSASSSS